MTKNTKENVIICEQSVYLNEQRIAARLLHLRQTLEIKRSDLAYALDIEEDELKSYELGFSPIPASILALSAIALGVNFDYFYNCQEETQLQNNIFLYSNNEYVLPSC